MDRNRKIEELNSKKIRRLFRRENQWTKLAKASICRHVITSFHRVFRFLKLTGIMLFVRRYDYRNISMTFYSFQSSSIFLDIQSWNQLFHIPTGHLKNYEINKREIWLFVSSVSVQCVAPITRLGSTNLEDRENKEWARERPIFSAKSHREKFDMWLHKHENKFYSVFEPFQISRFFVRNPNLSASRFCSKLNFSAILVHFEIALKFCFRTYSECTKIGSCDWSFEKEIARCDMAQKRTKILFSCIYHHGPSY